MDDPLLSAAETERSGQSALKAAGLAVISEELNPVYISLKQRATVLRAELAKLDAERRGTVAAVETLARETERLRLELADREARYEALNYQVDLHRGILTTLMTRYEEVRVSEATAAPAVFVVPAVTPQVPSGPRKGLIVAVAGLLGLMAGVLLGFLKHAWETAQPRLREAALRRAALERRPAGAVP